MSTIIQQSRVKELMRQAAMANDLPLSFADSVRVEWNTRFTRRMGDANHTKMRVRFSVPLFERATIEEQENTVFHEMCHIIARELYGSRIKPHGGEWAATMLKAGYKPERCHSVDRTGLKRTNKTCETQCGCRVHLVTPKKFGRIAAGEKWTCRACGGRLYIPGTKQEPEVIRAQRHTPTHIHTPTPTRVAVVTTVAPTPVRKATPPKIIRKGKKKNGKVGTPLVAVATKTWVNQ